MKWLLPDGYCRTPRIGFFTYLGPVVSLLALDEDEVRRIGRLVVSSGAVGAGLVVGRALELAGVTAQTEHIGHTGASGKIQGFQPSLNTVIFSMIQYIWST